QQRSGSFPDNPRKWALFMLRHVTLPYDIGPASQAEGAGEPDGECGINACDPIVGHYTQAARKRLRLSRGKRLPYIEHAEKNKTEQQIFPAKRGLVGDEAGRGRGPGIWCSPPNR